MQGPKADSSAIFHRILVNFDIIGHVASRTSEQSAQIRGTPLSWGAKTMVVAHQHSLFLLVYRANRKVSWKKLRKIGQMAKPEQVLALGVEPGGVPPFPSLLRIPGILDSDFDAESRVAFNAGSPSKSIVMVVEDIPREDFRI